jgi:hypothetical protein
MHDTSLQNLLDSWNGSKAIFFEFRISLGFLRMALTSETKAGCLDIQCLDTEYICGKTRWDDCELEVQQANDETEYGIPINYVIRDKKAGLEIRCGSLTVEELADFNDLVY